MQLYLPSLGLAVLVAWRGTRSGSLNASGGLAAATLGYTALASPLAVFGVCLLGFYLAGSRATKLGILSSRPPILLTTLRTCPRGTNGGISPWGTLVSLLGGLLVGVLAVVSLVAQGQAGACGLGRLAEVVVVAALSGFGGSMIDSLLGAIFQPTYFSQTRSLVVHSPHPSPAHPEEKIVRVPGSGWDVLTNNAVNFFSTAAVAGVVEGGVWLLEMHNLPDNRLEPEFIKQAMLPALDFVELSWHKAVDKGRNKGGALVLTGERNKGKFFSNGLQLACLAEYPTFFKDYYYKLLARLMTYPIQTVAAINGHCYAGGLCLALACDWRICRPDRTWLSMNELLFGAPIPAGMASVLQARLAEPVVRKVMLTAHKYTSAEALKDGLVDEVVEGTGSEETVQKALERAVRLAPLSETGVLRAMKETLYAPALVQLAQDETLLIGRPQQQNEDAFKALLAAEVNAKL
ncbi:enoyl-CoA hydratase/isomerase family protein [Rhodotorula toruloides]|uniref:Enoyl-CoA hydratase/isomerase family protein n=1 Tax=Rhodotorula toruloides TaxID=5286 RepID=A0A511KLU0_RHOTO|nr:enoyl-CoA hydratase/isomerase family protein [Rhodotorula toruloides]